MSNVIFYDRCLNVTLVRHLGDTHSCENTLTTVILVYRAN